ncbi:BRO-N domain-containing protein [Paremcibacter congregatus]|uniref:Bro-N domain-containing protein n=1 Tax=Paremcibacter congregatus TaxID=2043170 RepID=A0A2G4YUK4_9PROT|nr:BRO family protein [Paremcibacter congregatus]PHZ85930.1 hypothetical protein CRD36_04445 [Paremcibacter congregatus]QDE26895.1 hypothetical protein FIV45_06215 [Paremcibacter congregatus]
MTKQMNEVLTHTFNDTHKVRSVTLEGEPWFVAADICRALNIINTTTAIRALDKDEYKRISRKKHSAIFLGSRASSLNVISKAGMYSLVTRADRKGKPQVREFQRWVNHEVLPSIDETGGYQLDPGQTIPLPTSFAESMRQHAETLMKLAASDEALQREKAALAVSDAERVVALEKALVLEQEKRQHAEEIARHHLSDQW